MFKNKSIRRGDCDGAESHTDREVYEVEDLITGQHLLLCPKCLLSQMKLRSKGKTNGESETPLFDDVKIVR